MDIAGLRSLAVALTQIRTGSTTVPTVSELRDSVNHGSVEVDELLVSEIPESFPCLRLPVEYALHYYVGTEEKTTDDCLLHHDLLHSWEAQPNKGMISYTAGKRNPTKAVYQPPTYFLFDYDVPMISAERWAQVITKSDIESALPQVRPL